MILKSIRTRDKSEAIAVLAEFCDSPELLYASMHHLNGEYAVEVMRPTDTCADVVTPDASLAQVPAHATGR